MLRKLLRRLVFRSRWKQVKDLTTDQIYSIEYLTILNPLTEIKYRVIAIFKNIEYYYVLEQGYVCICNKDTGFPLPNKTYKPSESNFHYTADTWIHEYLKDRQEAKYGRKN